MITTTIKSRPNEDICLQLNFENHAFNYLCDCGMASDLTVKDCRDTAAIFVSHTHIDHFINFDGIMRHQLAIGRPVVIVGPRGIAKNVQAKLLSFSWDLLAYDDKAVSYEVRELSDDGHLDTYLLQTPLWQLQHLSREPAPAYVYENEAFRVSTCLLFHGIFTVAYLFEELPKVKLDIKSLPYKAGPWLQTLKAAFAQNLPDTELFPLPDTPILAGQLFQFLTWQRGFRTAYVIDHAATQANFDKILALIDHADELYIESYYGLDEIEMARKNNHSLASFSGQLARLAHVKKPIPIHFSRRYHDEADRQILLCQFYDAFTGLTPDLPPFA